MKQLIIRTSQYHYLEKGFKNWLDIMGYNQQTVYDMPNIIHEFLHYLEQKGITTIHLMHQQHIQQYYDYISQRSNQRRGGGLSEKYILMHMQAIEKFLEYLHQQNIRPVSNTGIRLTTPQRKDITILTKEEIQLLFSLTEREATDSSEAVMHYRDKILLVIFYSCGLRRNEGVHVSIDDINLDSRILHVKKGKNYKERFVPFNKTNAQYLQEWIYDWRPTLLKSRKEHHLFINKRGIPMCGKRLYDRLKLLQQASDEPTLQAKEIGLHTLRHSIATHLLQAGMSVEKIARFLGHSSLDSTQIYTHLINQ